jgi:alkanesulfonate monooxygenase SsuD/methylene tetrahydromethanopterin reductase-like flavin-dependent oxidoreductase (luciferase family)
MHVYMFHLMPWPHLPADFAQTHDTAWVVCENALYDAERGHEVYNRYLDEVELADQLGFDGVCVNEHHQNAYGLMPSPNIMAACLARRTTRAKLVILGNVLTLYDHPLRVA